MAKTELAFEDFVDAPDILYRVVSWRTWKDRRLRHTNWFATKEAAEQHVKWINDGRGEVVGIYEYRQTGT